MASVVATSTGGAVGGKQSAKIHKNRLKGLFKSIGDVLYEKLEPSLRCITQPFGLLRKKLKVFPLRVQIGQQLSKTDKKNCAAFEQLYKENLEENLTLKLGFSSNFFCKKFLHRLVFYGECSSFSQGAVNKQICKRWGSQRQNSVYGALQSSPTVMISCASLRTERVGPYLSGDGTDTAYRYKTLLRYNLFPEFANYSLPMSSQQDWASPHYALVVRQYLNYKPKSR